MARTRASKSTSPHRSPARRNRRADEAREREERYAAFIAQSSEGIWRLEFDPPMDTALPVDAQVDWAYRHGRLAECNLAMARMYGLDRIDDLVGVGLDFMLPSSDPAAREYLASIIRAGYRVDDVESVERDANGDIRYFSNSMSGIVEDGLLHRMWGTQRDISERRRVEESLRESEERFRHMADAAPVLIWVSGTDKRCTWFNRQWLEFVGRTLEQELGDGWAANVHPDDFGQCLSTYVAAFDARVPFSMEYRLRRNDGVYRWVLDSGLPRSSPGGEFSGYIGSCLDITERREESEQRGYLAAIIDSSDDAILSKDLNGVIQSCNAAAERIFGYRADELIGKPVRMLIPAERQQEEEGILARIRRGERVDHFETVRIRKDGRLVNISLTVSAVRNSAGVIVGASKVARDISERHAARLEHERLLEAERTARAEAERASRVKDDFVAMVSHELRTPLNAILGWTQLMTRAPQDPAVVSRGLDVVARNTRLQAQLISDLLDISRIVAGKMTLDVQSVEIGSVVAEALEAIDADARNKGITIRLSRDMRPATLAGDPSRLQQIVWNLLSNALKFTPHGGEVAVTVRSTEARTEIVVSDTGAGIRPEFLPHVFDRFIQADRSITRRFGGLGLGLSIVKHLTELHGGEVRAQSAGEGRGATFTVSLPTSIAGPGLDLAQPLLVIERPGSAVALKGVRVLAVEDEPDTLQFLKTLLEGHGATVLTAATAGDALEIFRSERPDVLISDIGLPEVDGYDLMQQIRRESAPGHRIAAIALTAYARAEDRTRALRAGFQAHLAKPVETSELLAMVASFAELTRLSGGQAPGPLRPQ